MNIVRALTDDKEGRTKQLNSGSDENCESPRESRRSKNVPVH